MFEYRGDELHCEGVSLTAIAADVGTPFYVMGFVEGRVIWEPQMPASSIAQLEASQTSGMLVVPLATRGELLGVVWVLRHGAELGHEQHPDGVVEAEQVAAPGGHQAEADEVGAVPLQLHAPRRRRRTPFVSTGRIPST